MATGTSPRRRIESLIIAWADTPGRRRRAVAFMSLCAAVLSLGLCAAVYWFTGLDPQTFGEWALAYGLPVVVPLIVTPIVAGHLLSLAGELHERSGELEEEVRRRRRAEARLAILVTTDDLTQLPNRRAFFARAAEIAGGSGIRATVAVLDLDNFKNLNDTDGHAAGDDALRSGGALMRAHIDPVGVVARLGGEEFGIILPGVATDEGRRLLDDLRAAFGAIRVDLTVSVGVAEWHPGESIDTALGRADAALYRAKQRGRNRVEVASTSDPSSGLGSDLAPVARR